MQMTIRFAAISSAVILTVACGAPNEQPGAPPQGSALTTPADGTPGAQPGNAGTPPATRTLQRRRRALTCVHRQLPPRPCRRLR